MGEEALVTTGITKPLMHSQEETEPAGKQDWLEIDLSLVPGGREGGGEGCVAALGLAGSSPEA